jgi:methionyl aminopeptidase
MIALPLFKTTKDSLAPCAYLLEGDLVSLDLGATFEGAIADAAFTCIYGEPKSKEHVRLIRTCHDALYVAIKAIKVGKRLGVIGNAIHKYCKDSGYNLITKYGGHGLDYNIPHAEPFVANKSKTTDGIRIRPGLSIAIEPMLVIGQAKTKVESDGWTVVTPGIGAHFEHSVTVTETGNHIITEMMPIDVE